MSNQIAFAIDDAIPVGANKWQVNGRAYEDVKVGDLVMIYHESQTQRHVDVVFAVVAISAYGRDIPELSRGLTGSLIVEGQRGDLLKGAGTLTRSI